MIHALSNQRLEVSDKPAGYATSMSGDFADLFDDVTKAVSKPANQIAAPATPASAPANQIATPSNPASDPAATPASTSNAPIAPSGSGALQPNVQAWLTSYYNELSANNPMISASDANIPYEPAQGAGSNYSINTAYGPDQIYTQALYNQNGYEFANLSGGNAANYTSQLPGIPTQAAQQAWDHTLAIENAMRLASGQPIDTSAYWSDPGSINYDGVTYTSAELGYTGPCQSSGPQPIYISQGDQVPGTNTFSVPGYSGTVTGLQPDKWYTLQQLEAAGLQAGQPDAQFHPGSWSAA